MKVVVSMVTPAWLMKRCDTPLIFNLEHMLNLQQRCHNDPISADTVHSNDSHFISKMNHFFSFFEIKPAVMQTYENKGAEVFTNGSAGHTNGAELSRMREVAFKKNESEPLVRRHTLQFIYQGFFLTGCPLDLGGDSEAQ